LRDKLAEYMIPANFFFFDRFPVNASGKTDRGKIGDLVSDRLSDCERVFSQPDKSAEQVLSVIREINSALTQERILGAKNLIDAGMDSLSFVRFTVALEEQFGLRLDEATVVELSMMPFGDLVARVGLKSDSIVQPS